MRRSFGASDRAVFGNPEKFRPERWIESPGLPLASLGLGRRICPGQHAASDTVAILWQLLLLVCCLRALLIRGRLVRFLMCPLGRSWIPDFEVAAFDMMRRSGALACLGCNPVVPCMVLKVNSLSLILECSMYCYYTCSWSVRTEAPSLESLH